MFMKQYNYKPRSGSQSSGTAGSPPKEPVKTASVTDQVQGASSVDAKSPGRRRSSAGAEKFAGLSAHKRGSSDHGDRKASYADQKVGGSGILGGMWNSFTKGS